MKILRKLISLTDRASRGYGKCVLVGANYYAVTDGFFLVAYPRAKDDSLKSMTALDDLLQINHSVNCPNFETILAGSFKPIDVNVKSLQTIIENVSSKGKVYLDLETLQLGEAGFDLAILAKIYKWAKKEKEWHTLKSVTRDGHTVMLNFEHEMRVVLVPALAPEGSKRTPDIEVKEKAPKKKTAPAAKVSGLKSYRVVPPWETQPKNVEFLVKKKRLVAV